jgi:hypothetical protein
MQDFEFTWRWMWILPSYGMWRCVVWYMFTDVSEKCEDGSNDFSETSVNLYQALRHHILENGNIHSYCRQKRSSEETLVCLLHDVRPITRNCIARSIRPHNSNHRPLEYGGGITVGGKLKTVFLVTRCDPSQIVSQCSWAVGWNCQAVLPFIDRPSMIPGLWIEQKKSTTAMCVATECSSP